jgi:arginase
MNRVTVLGVPSSAGARRTGQECGPQLLRQRGLIERLSSAGLELVDYGDLPKTVFHPDTRNPKQQNITLVSAVARLVANRVFEAVRNQTKVVVLGGDCTITLGVLDGLGRHFSNLGLLYLDGDIDLNTPADTVSGILDGMGMAHIIGKGAHELTHIGSRYPLLPESNIVLFGFNADSGWIDPPEIQRLKESSMIQYPLSEIRGRTESASRKALTQLEAKVDQILVHFDVDVIDFHDFPGADVPHEHGLSLRETMETLKMFVSSPKFIGLVITEFNADRDADGTLAMRLVENLADVLRYGHTRWVKM